MCSAPSVGGDYDEKVRLVEETLQAGGWLIACCSPAVDKRARGDWAEMLGLLLFPPRSRLAAPEFPDSVG